MNGSKATSASGGRGPRTATGAVLGGALRQARIELRVQLFSWSALSWILFPAIGLAVLWFLRGQSVMGSEISLAQLGVPGILVMSLVSSGFMAVAGQLITEREDGTLLRAKATPLGIRSHLLGNVLLALGTTFVPILAFVLAAALVFGDAVPQGIGGWVTFGWVSVLGLCAVLPAGAVFGALVRDVAAFGWASIFVYGSFAISGVFYPLAALPTWLHYLAQALPPYWIGLGMRSAFLPQDAVALEIGQSWRVLETVGVLGAWSVIGLLLAPLALSRMARRQSGSEVAAARDRVMAKGY